MATAKEAIGVRYANTPVEAADIFFKAKLWAK